MKRPKKPNLSSIQQKKFSGLIEGLRHRPHSGIINRIDSKMFSLDGNILFKYKTEDLAFKEYQRCHELFENRLPQEFALPTQEAAAKLRMQIQMTRNVIFTKEMKHIESLKEIAVDTIRYLFDVPEHININPNINMDLDLGQENQDDSLEPLISLSLEEQREMHKEIQKRVILNGLVHGASMHIWKSAHYIVKDKIDELDPMLMDLYNLYTSSVGWLIWQVNPDSFQDAIASNSSITQGFNKLEFKEPGEPECNVLCHGVNFPVLLHEITKGSLDYLICRGIPEEYSEEQLRYYYAVADSYENELYHYLLSPTIWMSLVEAANLDTQELPGLIANLTQLNYQDLAETLKRCVDSPEEGRQKLNSLKFI